MCRRARTDKYTNFLSEYQPIKAVFSGQFCAFPLYCPKLREETEVRRERIAPRPAGQSLSDVKSRSLRVVLSENIGPRLVRISPRLFSSAALFPWRYFFSATPFFPGFSSPRAARGVSKTSPVQYFVRENELSSASCPKF